MNLNSPPSPFPIQHQIYSGDIDQPYQPFGTNNPSSSPAVSCHIFFNSTQDHMGYYHQDEIYQPQHVSDDYSPDYNQGYEIKNKVTDQSGQLKLTLWKKQDHGGHDQENNNNHHPMKWVSSKMRLMHKMKSHPGRVTLKITGAAKGKTDSGSNNLSCHRSSYTENNNPIRVCSDCNTTKTPLWRSGPKGPKSLCNACGIRQRKARRAMAAAAAAAAANGASVSASAYIQPSTASTKIKVQQHKGKNEHLKKGFETGIDAANSEAASSSNVQKKISFEDFLINLSKNLTFHRVFPEDEKDAAILLMALSSGLVHG